MSGAWSTGSTRAWRELRDYVLERDGRRCRRLVPPAGAECGELATTAGHIVDKDLGGTDHPDNLRAECGACNYGAGARAGNRKRARA
jgi:5-methylcytosine-specific restriction endonuclease McrA